MRTQTYERNAYGNMNLVEYRASQPAGLPPRPRRQHRCPLGLHLSDLVSMSVVAMTLAATGMVLSGM